MHSFILIAAATASAAVALPTFPLQHGNGPVNNIDSGINQKIDAGEMAMGGEKANVFDRRQLPGDSVNGPSAVSHPFVNNGASVEGSIKDKHSMDGSVISNPIGNTLTHVNNNADFHDNIVENPNINSAKNTHGNVAVGNGNQVFPIDNGLGWNGIVFKRQLGGGMPMVNAPSAINTPKVNNGVSREGTLGAGMSANGASFVNPVGNTFAQANSNKDVSGNNFQNPNWNQISGNTGPSMAGNHNIFVPVTNEQGAIQFDNGDLMNAAMVAGGWGYF